MKNGDFELKSGAPGGTRTHDPLLRRQMLYPAELPELILFIPVGGKAFVDQIQKESALRTGKCIV